MSWVRFGQLSAEGQSLADVAGLNGTGYTVSNTAAYTGSWSYRTSSSNAPLGFAGAFGAAARCGFYFRHNGQTSVNAPVIGFLVDGAPLVFLFNMSNNDLSLRAGFVAGTNILRTALTVNAPVLATLNTWMHIGMSAHIAAIDGFVSFYVNGTQIAVWTGDTRLYRINETTPRTQITGVYAAGYLNNWPGGGAGGWSNYVYIDDFYVDLWAGEAAPANAAPSSRRFLATFPSGAGDSAQWTPNTGANWQALTQAPPDNDATYNRATAAGLVDLVEMSDIVVPPEWTVRAVIPTLYARKTDAGVNSQVKLKLKNSAGVLTSNAKPLPISYGYVWERWTAQADDSPWSEAAVNVTQMGYESAGDYS